MRRIDQFVAVFDVLLPPEILDEQPDRGALGVPQHEPGTDFVLHGDQIQFLADLAVVAPLDFFQTGQMRVEFGLRREGRPVDALQHRIPFVPAPVGAGRVEQFECADMAGGRQVRTAAEIDEVPLRIGGDRLPVREALDQLHLIVLSLSLEELDGVLLAEFPPGDGKLPLGDFLRARFDLFQIFRGEGPFVGEVVVEAVFERWADRQLRAREQFLDGLRHQVGAAVAVDFTALRAVEAKRFDERVPRQDRRKIGGLPVDGSGQQVRSHGDSARGERLGDGLTGRNIITRSVFEGHLRHERSFPSSDATRTISPDRCGVPPQIPVEIH